MDKNKFFKGTITAKGTEITVLSKGTDNDYISLTDIARYKNSRVFTYRAIKCFFIILPLLMFLSDR
jgi:hypothetical protein